MSPGKTSTSCRMCAGDTGLAFLLPNNLLNSPIVKHTSNHRILKIRAFARPQHTIFKLFHAGSQTIGQSPDDHPGNSYSGMVTNLLSSTTPKSHSTMAWNRYYIFVKD